ncbi:energy-coupling factor transporter transmembrane protein EcfT [Tersicoccus sp. MR15.9]|uniref:energy-coupling factor transporter transmembrane component T family protein n=1 Tax=Tersicoccus mangrovi TaxID=3121635 RepID=UPI002FE61322
MSAARELGAYWPGDSPVHRARLRVKAVGMVLVSVAAVLARDPLPALALLAVVLLVAGSSRVPARRVFAPARAGWVVLLLVGGYQVLAGGGSAPSIGQAVAVVAVLLAAMTSAQLLTATTPTGRLLDGVVTAVRPLRRLGADPDRFALTTLIVLRSLPWIAGAFDDARDAALARGLQRSLRARTLPVVLRTVDHAQRTGLALAARGLGDPVPPGAER